MILPRSGPRLVSACLFLITTCLLAVATAGATPNQRLTARDYTGYRLGNSSGYGSTMATAGDWLAVGAPNGTQDGWNGPYRNSSVLLWKREAGTWKLKQELLPPGGLEAEFGRTLVMEGTRLLISTAASQGRVHVYQLQQDVWILEGTLQAVSGSPTNAGFGDSLALSGNLALVSSPSGSTPPSDSPRGWVDVYAWEASAWVYKTRLAEAGAGNYVGASVALHGNMILIGCPNADMPRTPSYLPPHSHAGKIAVFERSGGETWSKTREVFSPVPTSDDAFGGEMLVHEGQLFVISPSPSNPKLDELSISGGFGHTQRLNLPLLRTQGIFMAASSTHLAVGGQGTTSGLYVFRRGPGGSWAAENHDLRGGLSDKHYSAAWDGDRLLLGGSIDSFNTIDEWSVRTALSIDGSWEFTGRIQPVDLLSLDNTDFGRSLSRDGNWLFIGAPSVVELGGFVYAYQKGVESRYTFHSLLPQPVVPRTTTYFPTGFGSHVTSAGGRVAVGANMGTFSQSRAIIIYAWDAPTQSWMQESIVTAPPNRTGYGFGYVFAFTGDFLAVGSPGDKGVFLYTRTGTSWNFTEVLTAPSGAPGESFGQALSLSGQRLLVGSPEFMKGSAYLFELKNGTWTQISRLAPPPSFVALEKFGEVVALDSDRALVAGGSCLFTLGHMYQRSGTTWKYHMDLPLPWSSYSDARSAALSGSLVVVNTRQGVYPCGLVQGKWVNLPYLGDTWGAAGLVVDGQEAIFGDGLPVGDPSTYVTVQNLIRPPLVEWSGTVEGPARVESGATHLEAGQYAVGARIDQWFRFRISNASALPVRVTATLSGDSADASFATPAWDLGGSAKTDAWLRFHPKTEGEKEITLRFFVGGAEGASTSYVIHAWAVAQAVPASFLQISQSGITEVGAEPLTLGAYVTGTRPRTLRWLKNGAYIPGETSDTLTLKTGGNYQVEVTNPAGKVRSPVIARGFFEVKAPSVYALAGQAARCAVTLSGPGMKVHWSATNELGSDFLEDNASYAGSHTPTLTLRRARPELSGEYTPNITMPSPEGILEASASVAFTVVTPPQLLPFPSERILLHVGQPDAISIAYQFDGSYNAPDPVFTVTGLPPGMKLEGGFIIGIPIKPGQYRVTITARLAQFTMAPLVQDFVVIDPGLYMPGLYWGWVERSPSFPLAGAVTLDLRADGTFTGSLQAGTKKHPFTGLLGESNSYSSTRARLGHSFPGGAPHLAWVQQSQLDSDTLQLLVRPVDGQETDNQMISQLLLIKARSSSVAPPPQIGRHSFAIIGGGDWNASPSGHGFGTLSIAADRRGTFSGQLADGSGITGAGWLSGDEAGPWFHFYAVDSSGKSSIHGTLPLSETETETESESAEGYATWTKLPVSGRLHPEGFQEVSTYMYSSRYQPATAAETFHTDSTTLEMNNNLGFTKSAPFHFSRAWQASFGTPAENSLKATLSVFASTGFFTGQVTLRDEDPGNAERTIVRTVQYRGMLLPAARAGYGYSLLPSLPDPQADPPTTLSTSPITSAAVLISP